LLWFDQSVPLTISHDYNDFYKMCFKVWTNNDEASFNITFYASLIYCDNFNSDKIKQIDYLDLAVTVNQFKKSCSNYIYIIMLR